MDGSRGFCAEWNKSDRERQMPYDFTYMWNLKNKINEQADQKQTHRYREHFDGCQMKGGLKRCIKKISEGIKKYKLVVTEYS